MRKRNGDHKALGELTGDVYRALAAFRDAKDTRSQRILSWVHEKICYARYQLDGEEWPENRKIPALPKFAPSKKIVSR